MDDWKTLPCVVPMPMAEADPRVVRAFATGDFAGMGRKMIDAARAVAQGKAHAR